MNIIRILFFAFLCILSSCNSDENLKIRQNLLLEELKSGILVCNDYRAKTIDWEFDRYRNKERKDFVLSASFSLDSVYNHFISKFNLTIKNEKLSESQWLSLHKIMVENTEANLKVIERAHIIHGTDADKRFFDEISKAVKDNSGFCPCLVDTSEDTKCICKEFREQETEGLCHCGRYLKTKI